MRTEENWCCWTKEIRDDTNSDLQLCGDMGIRHPLYKNLGIQKSIVSYLDDGGPLLQEVEWKPFLSKKLEWSGNTS